MNPTFTIELRQHSPMVHFQHHENADYSESEATLRASDFKPRLDRYLKKLVRYKDNPIPAYRLRIQTIGGIETLIIEHGEPYFGNKMHKKIYSDDSEATRDKKSNFNREVMKSNIVKIMNKNGIRLVFNTGFNEQLRSDIEKTLPEFLALESFGTRNNKGYGCFYQVGDDRNQFETSLRNLQQKKKIGKVYFWDCDEKNVLSAIALFNRWIKSGINIFGRKKGEDAPKAYHKSILYLYAYSKGICWDKRKVKEAFLAPVIPWEPNERRKTKANPCPSNSQQAEFYRVMLGLSTDNAWMSYPGKPKLEIRPPRGIARVPNPLMYKVFNGKPSRIYVFPRRDITNNELLYGQEYTFEMVNRSKKPFRLSSPAKFEYDDFLDFAAKIINKTNPDIPTDPNTDPNIVVRTEKQVKELNLTKLE